MAIQDEHNKKIVSVSMEASKMTLKSFAKTIKFLWTNRVKLQNLKTKRSLKSLAKNEFSISKIELENLELQNKDLKIFKKIAKNCGLKYALHHDKEKNTYTFFFSSGKAEIYEQVYNGLRKGIEKRENKQENIIKEKIKQKHKIVKEMQKEKKQKQTNKMSR